MKRIELLIAHADETAAEFFERIKEAQAKVKKDKSVPADEYNGEPSLYFKDWYSV